MAQQNGPKKDAASDPQYASVDRLAQLTANPAIPRRKKPAQADYNALAQAMKHDDDDLFLMADATHDDVPLATSSAMPTQPAKVVPAASQVVAQPAAKPAAHPDAAQATLADAKSAPAIAPVVDSESRTAAPAAQPVAAPQDEPASEQSWPVDIQRPAPMPLVDDQPAAHQHVMTRSGLAPRFTPAPSFQQMDEAYATYRRNK